MSRDAALTSLEFTAANFTSAANRILASILEGMKAHIDFFEASGKSAEGQIFSIELSK